MADRAPSHRNRFNRRGEVVTDRRTQPYYVGTDDYQTGWPLFTPRRSSPAREAFKERRRQARASARNRAA